MANSNEVTITTGLNDLTTQFNQVKEVYFLKTPNQKVAEITVFDFELPILSDGVTFNSGEPNVTEIKLTTQEVWTSIAEAGDPDIQFQVASVAGGVNELLMAKKTDTLTMAKTVGEETFEGEGYDMSPKKVTGGLFLRSADRATAIFLPNVECYASFVAGDSSKPAYFNTKWTAHKDASGSQIYILRKKVVTEGGN